MRTRSSCAIVNPSVTSNEIDQRWTKGKVMLRQLFCMGAKTRMIGALLFLNIAVVPVFAFAHILRSTTRSFLPELPVVHPGLSRSKISSFSHPTSGRTPTGALSYSETPTTASHEPKDASQTMVGPFNPADIEFVAPVKQVPSIPVNSVPSPARPSEAPVTTAAWSAQGLYPFAAMLQGSASYIADHAGKTAVFHLPGELLHDDTKKKDGVAYSKRDTKAADALLQDIALCWLLRVKIVVVVAGRYERTDSSRRRESDDEAESEIDGASAASDATSLSTLCDLDYSHECHNELATTDAMALRHCEEEAGYLRTEMERKLNRCLRSHGSAASSSSMEGNVVSGNAFFTARQFGTVRGKDFKSTGFCQTVHTEPINRVLDSNDVVLLSDVGMSSMGELVHVNSYHLAASVAASLNASKLIYMAHQQGAVLKHRDAVRPIQELPVSWAQAMTDYHQVTCHGATGFATFRRAKQSLSPSAVELLLHLGWSTWAVRNGCTRAHMVNPGDGGLLEELFTSKNGANTCLYHDEDVEFAKRHKKKHSSEGRHNFDIEADYDDDDDLESTAEWMSDWDAFFRSEEEDQPDE